MKILSFFNALLYALIAGQGFYMLLGGSRALQQLSVGAFIEQRQSVDKAIARNLSLSYLLTFVYSASYIFLLVWNEAPQVQVAASILAFLLLVADAFIATRGNAPLNKEINSWREHAHPLDWTTHRDLWISYMTWRNWLSILALAVFLLVLTQF
ncbi:MAG: hypothetical protein DYG98_05095 [Haliscomenobacteraceae bacterium CHB4]|nr:hypothetical protein [Saprospiraceae bacterium]MCE7922410.1 hypothetical protein [Haliscomenobacteraceae bacterium CHB4]